MTRFNAFAGAMPAAVHAPRAARELRRLGKFAVVGLSGFIVDFAVLNCSCSASGCPPGRPTPARSRQPSATPSSGTVPGTFRESRRRPLTTQLAQFFLVNLAGLGINMLTFLGSHALIWSHFFAPRWSYNLAKATAAGSGLVLELRRQPRLDLAWTLNDVKTY